MEDRMVISGRAQIVHQRILAFMDVASAEMKAVGDPDARMQLEKLVVGAGRFAGVVTQLANSMNPASEMDICIYSRFEVEDLLGKAEMFCLIASDVFEN